MALVTLILNDTMKGVMSDIEEWINRFVPKRTGQLRDSLKMNLKSTRVRNGILRVILGTHLNYAPDVAEMTTSQVRHDGEVGYAYYYGHYGRIILDDPEAIGGFWTKLLEYARERAIFHLVVAKNRYLTPTGIPTKYFKEMSVAKV